MILLNWHVTFDTTELERYEYDIQASSSFTAISIAKKMFAEYGSDLDTIRRIKVDKF